MTGQVFFFLFRFVCTFGCSLIRIFADGEPSHQDPESRREKQYAKILLGSLNASCFYCTQRCGRPTATNTLTLSCIIFISFDVFGGRMAVTDRYENSIDLLIFTKCWIISLIYAVKRGAHFVHSVRIAGTVNVMLLLPPLWQFFLFQLHSYYGSSIFVIDLQTFKSMYHHKVWSLLPSSWQALEISHSTSIFWLHFSEKVECQRRKIAA